MAPFPYTSGMSSTAPPRPETPSTRLASLWQRVSEGRRIDDLWSQFAADARSSYGFYGKDLDWDEINKLPTWKRPFRIGWDLLVAMLYKLTPARRIILIIAMVFLVLSGVQIQVGGERVEIHGETFSALLLILLLSLELAD